MINSFILFAYHIGMALKDNCRNIFISRCSLLGYKHITGLICLAGKIILCSKLLKISDYMLFVAGFSWNPCYLLKEGQYFL